MSLTTMTIDPAVTTLGLAGVGHAGPRARRRPDLATPRPVPARRRLGRWLPALRHFFNRHGALFASTDAIVQDYLVWHRRRFWISSLAFLAGWLGGALEAWVLLWIMGLPAHAGAALLIQATLTVVNRLTAFVPASLGTHEAGALMVFAVVGLPGEGAMAFALLRRARQIAWIAAGLALFPRRPQARSLPRAGEAALTMQYRALGHTGLTVSVLGLGM